MHAHGLALARRDLANTEVGAAMSMLEVMNVIGKLGRMLFLSFSRI